MNIFFSNPEETDEQKQDWILISTPTTFERVKALVNDDNRLLLDQEKADKESQDSGKIVLLTRYFKKNGEIWCERGTKYTMINRPFRLTPDKSSVMGLLNKETSINNSDDVNSEPIRSEIAYLGEILEKKPPKAVLYPIVCGCYERREGSIYGISEVEGLIPNQKAINFNVAMTLLNSQQCAWGKYIALPNALKGQAISNSPGQVLIDYSGTGEGIKRMKDEGISQIPMSIVQAITELTRTVTGSNDIISGEALSTNLSGVAIAQLQAQAEVPIEELRATFWEAKRKQGLVLAQFIRLYYYDKEFVRVVKDEKGDDLEICDHFFSEEYEDCVFDVVVEPTRGTRASVTSDINLLDACLKNGSISFETYIKAYPEGSISNKYSILKQVEKEKADEIHTLRKELEKYKKSKTGDPVSIV